MGGLGCKIYHSHKGTKTQIVKELLDQNEILVEVREHLLYMQELGVELVDVDLTVFGDVGSVRSVVKGSSAEVGAARPQVAPQYSRPPAEPVVYEKPPATLQIPQPKTQKPKISTPGARLASLPSLSRREKTNLSANDNSRPEKDTILRQAASITEENEIVRPKPIEVAHATVPAIDHSNDTIEGIRAEIGDCTRCKLHSLGRTQIVHTTGNFQSDLMFIGEAPGADEDEQGFPFVGRAGQLLTKIIESIGIKREDVVIGNINRCRPPGNRQPEPDETAQCRPFIIREIAVVKPKVVVVLGATAAHNLLQVKTPISKLRGQFHDYFDVKVMPTFHPAYLLRDPHKKREVWEDMKKVRDLLQGRSTD